MLDCIVEWGLPRSLSHALEQVAATADICATHAKWQALTPENLASQDARRYWDADLGGHPSQAETFRRGHAPLSIDEWRQLFRHCRQYAIEPVVTPFDLGQVEIMEAAEVGAYKIASGDINYHDLVRRIARAQKPVYLSTGAASLAETRRAIQWLGEGRSDVVVMACDLVYPCEPVDSSLAQQLSQLRILRGDVRRVGYSDHTREVITGAVAVTCGATVLEKHVTLCPGGLTPDDNMALTVDEAGRYFSHALEAAALCEKSTGDPQAPARRGARRSAYAAYDIEAGDALTNRNVAWLRPCNPSDIPPSIDLSGQRLKYAITAGTPITWENLTGDSVPGPFTLEDSE